MFDLVILLLIVIALCAALSFRVRLATPTVPSFLRTWWSAAIATFAVTLIGCSSLGILIQVPTPRVHDEFSYILLGDTISHGRMANPAPPLPEFFETFHELVRNVYASKYFPVQGLFLAMGESITGHFYIGIWLSSALACVAFIWMLQGWISPRWALLGALVTVFHYGIYSYWSQTYWGGFATALGGALFFGSLPRLWGRFSWQNSIWLALGLLILANSRPTEGALAALPGTTLLLRKVIKDRRWRENGFWTKFVLPVLALLALGVIATVSYNKAITGSALKLPYVLHEQQYQESPPFIFLPKRPPLTYTSVWLRYYYEFREIHAYDLQRIPKLWPLAVARKIATWWDFYCGVLFSVPLFLPGLMKKGKVRIFQGVFLVGLLLLPAISDYKIAWRILIDLLAVLEIGVLWYLFDDLWGKLAVGTGALLLFELFFTKWSFPHYFAPAACLVWYLEIEGLRRIWNWTPQPAADRALSRSERRRLAREHESKPKRALNLRGFVYLFPIICAISLILRVEARLQGWEVDPHGPDRGALVLNDWAVRRAELDKWMEQQPTPQLAFVRYTRWHNVNDEWVFNHADIMHSHVIWARDLGVEHNKLLLNILPDRTAWLLDADVATPQLVPYAEGINTPPPSSPYGVPRRVEQEEQANW